MQRPILRAESTKLRTNDSDACFIKEFFNKRDVIKNFPHKKSHLIQKLSGFWLNIRCINVKYSRSIY